MIQELKINYFGCSFTALEHSLTGHIFKTYRRIIQEKLQLDHNNFSKTGKSNQHIIDDIYNQINLIEKEKNNNFKHLFVIQTTFLDRYGLFCHISNDEFISLCKREGPEFYWDEIKINFYNDWLKYFYSLDNSIKDFIKQIDLICTYLKSKNIEFVCIGMDDALNFIKDKNFFERNNFILFDKTYAFYEYAVKNQLRISDINPQYFDHHFNSDGHKILANFILNTIK